MPLTDKVAAANQINDLLKMILSGAGFRLKYRITVNPPATGREDWRQPEITVQFAGPDSPILLARNNALLNALEHLAVKALHLESEEHDRIGFDCENSRQVHLEEIRMAADVAAERVRKSGMPYKFAPMNSRDRRAIHLALSQPGDLRTESEGEGPQRCVVVYPKDYKPGPVKHVGRRR